MTLFYSFANLFNAWLNRSQLDSSICFCVQSVAVSHIMSPLETSLCTPEHTRMKETKTKQNNQKCVCIIMKIILTL